MKILIAGVNREIQKLEKHLFAGVNREIQKLEKRLSELRRVSDILRGLNSAEPATPSRRPAKEKRNRTRPYREYILDILKENGSLTTSEIMRELGKVGVRPFSPQPKTVISGAVRTMYRQDLLQRTRSRRGFLYSIPAVKADGQPIEM